MRYQWSVSNILFWWHFFFSELSPQIGCLCQYQPGVKPEYFIRRGRRGQNTLEEWKIITNETISNSFIIIFIAFLCLTKLVLLLWYWCKNWGASVGHSSIPDIINSKEIIHDQVATEREIWQKRNQSVLLPGTLVSARECRKGMLQQLNHT